MKIRNFPQPVRMVLRYAEDVYPCANDAGRNVDRATELAQRLDDEVGERWLRAVLGLYGLFASWYRNIGGDPDALEVPTSPIGDRDSKLDDLRDAVGAQMLDQEVIAWFVVWFAHWLRWQYENDGAAQFARYVRDAGYGGEPLPGEVTHPNATALALVLRAAASEPVRGDRHDAALAAIEATGRWLLLRSHSGSDSAAQAALAARAAALLAREFGLGTHHYDPSSSTGPVVAIVRFLSATRRNDAAAVDAAARELFQALAEILASDVRLRFPHSHHAFLAEVEAAMRAGGDAP